jgi:hypothetical protein
MPADTIDFSTPDASRYSLVLGLDFSSKTRGEYSLVLIRPWPPYGRPVRGLRRLRSLNEQDVDLIYAWLADKQDPKGARIEIFTTNEDKFAVSCKRIEGLPARIDAAL